MIVVAVSKRERTGSKRFVHGMNEDNTMKFESHEMLLDAIHEAAEDAIVGGHVPIAVVTQIQEATRKLRPFVAAASRRKMGHYWTRTHSRSGSRTPASGLRCSRRCCATICRRSDHARRD